MITKSSDLIHWVQHFINTPHGFVAAYAPQWFVDNKRVSIIVSLSNGRNEYDIFNRRILFFKSYMMSSRDRSLMHFSKPIPIYFSKEDNHIDACMIKKNSKYYIFVKNEHDKIIDEFVSKRLYGKYFFIQTLNFNEYVEGPAIAKRNNKYYLYADEYSIGKSAAIISNDLLHWSKPIDASSINDTRTQHFDIYKLNKEAQTKVKRAVIKNLHH